MVCFKGTFQGPGLGSGVRRGIFIEPLTPLAALSPKELEECWAAIASEDLPTAHRNVSLLIASAQTSVPYLKDRVAPLAPLDTRRVHAWIADLDDDRFEVRERATAALERAAELARPALEAALAKRPSPEARTRLEALLRKLDGPRSPEQLRALRAVEALKYMDNPESRALLQTLAGGAEGARLTQEAKAALQPRK
jgi:hypothetical protein